MGEARAAEWRGERLERQFAPPRGGANKAKVNAMFELETAAGDGNVDGGGGGGCGDVWRWRLLWRYDRRSFLIKIL